MMLNILNFYIGMVLHALGGVIFLKHASVLFLVVENGIAEWTGHQKST